PTPTVSEPCPGATASGATAPGGGARSGPPDGPPNHADNRAFRGTVPLTAESRCRGEREARRVTAALAAPRPGTVSDSAVRDALAGLGYAPDTIEVDPPASGRVTFTVGLYPVCLEGSTDGRTSEVDVHGVYMEGGCERPAGGH
ncbi:hypothetical protein, partial [Streptomyces sp. URMC 123]|uniref:hypothetical protein n=1 Tax=Streptomyces sp. URMC 123 TaxID=3423403 RepID=UPI003F1BC19A